MFNNPLKKYQQGGQVSQEQQQMLAAFVEWLPKRVKEFQGMQPEQIVEALNGMSKSPEGQKQIQAYMQQFQQELQEQQAGMFKDGGKLQDFICKHAKGGKAGCGCKEDGGKVEKAEMGLGGLNDHSPRPASINVPTIPGLIAEFRQHKVADSGNATNRNFSKVNWRGNQYFLERANIDGNTADTWIQVTPKLDTLVEQTLPSGRVTPLTIEQAQSIVDRNRADINSKEKGGVVKGQNSIPGGMPGPDPSTITYSDSPYARAEGRTNEMIITPQAHVTLLTSPSSVGERRDSLFLVRPEDMFGKSTEAERRYRSFFKFKDNEHYPNGAAGNFDNIRAWWEAYKARARKNVSY